MNRFRVTFEHTIEQANDDGAYEPFDHGSRTIHHLKRHQLKFIEGLLLDAAAKMHAEGMRHKEVLPYLPAARETVEQEMRHPVKEPKGKK